MSETANFPGLKPFRTVFRPFGKKPIVQEWDDPVKAEKYLKEMKRINPPAEMSQIEQTARRVINDRDKEQSHQ